MKYSFLLVLIVALLPNCGRKKQAVSNDQAGQAKPASTRTLPTDAALAAPVTPHPLQQVLATHSLCEAIHATRPHMSDGKDRRSEGSLFIEIWMLENSVAWGELSLLGETSYELVMKDPDEERGRRICAEGRIVEIQAENGIGGKSYHGALAIGSGFGKIIRFDAVRSTEGLVARSTAKFCGVAIGIFSYTNAAGGTTHSVNAVGMFDLDENTKAPECREFCNLGKKCKTGFKFDECLEGCRKGEVLPSMLTCVSRKWCSLVFDECMASIEGAYRRINAWLQEQRAAKRSDRDLEKEVNRKGFCAFVQPAASPKGAR